MSDELAAAHLKISAQGHAEVQRAIGGIHGGLRQLAVIGGALGSLFSVGALAVGLKRFNDAAIEAEENGAKLEAVLNATGFAAGMTGGEMQALATRLQDVSRFEDDAIIKAEMMLARFRHVEGGVFKQALVAAMDLSTVLGTDLSSSATQLGRALDSPVQGLAALRRAGINFSAEQKATVANLTKTNQLAAAQKIILQEVNAQVGGSAAAAAKTTAGAIDQLKNAWGELEEIVGRSLGTSIRPTLEYWTKKLREIRDLMPEQEQTNRLIRVPESRNQSPDQQIAAIMAKYRELFVQERAETQRKKEAQANIDQFQWLSDLTGRPNQPSQQNIVNEAEGKLLEIRIARERIDDLLLSAESRKRIDDGSKAILDGAKSLKERLAPHLEAAAVAAKKFHDEATALGRRQADAREDAARDIMDRIDRASAYIDEMKGGGRVDNVDVGQHDPVMQRVGLIELANQIQQGLGDSKLQQQMKKIAEEQRDATLRIDQFNTGTLGPTMQKVADLKLGLV